MKTNHFEGLCWYIILQAIIICEDYTTSYNIAKNHNQRYTIIEKCDCGFYIIVLTKDSLLAMYLDYFLLLSMLLKVFDMVNLYVCTLK